MLARIEIRHFAIIQSLDLDWHSGMTVITGETGAGKSIVIDALGLVLGERADPSMIYAGAEQAEVTAIFELAGQTDALTWLAEQELTEEQSCILRRVISSEGRSKCFINGRSATLSQLKELGSLLVDIHGQHAHQSLLKGKEQTALLDRYADHPALLESVKKAAQNIRLIETKKHELEAEKAARDAKRELLTYQVEELQTANPQSEILETLEADHQRAATIQERLSFAEAGLQLIDGEEEFSCMSGLSRAIESLSRLTQLDPQASLIYDTVVQAESLLQDARTDLQHYHDRMDIDESRLVELDQQLSVFHDLARKHHVALALLPEKYQQLQQELEQLEADDQQLANIEQEWRKAVEYYQGQAHKLTESRLKVIKKLQKQVTEHLQKLAMEGGKFEISLADATQSFSALGNEVAEFLVSANPGQPLQPLAKVASGGELSRISLSIAVVTAEQQLVPVLIFDEVDVGIGGGTAEVVGKLLAKLGEQRQVICVTHQPQVAACGDHHLVASKTKKSNSTQTQMTMLDDKQRIEEVGRMLGGLHISEKTLSHAREMLGID